MSITFVDLAVGKRFWYNSQWYIKVREHKDGMNAECEPLRRTPKYRRVEPWAIVQYKG